MDQLHIYRSSRTHLCSRCRGRSICSMFCNPSRPRTWGSLPSYHLEVLLCPS